MELSDIQTRYEEIRSKVSQLGRFFDAPAREKELKALEEQIAEPDFWNDQERAQKIVQKRSRIEKSLERQSGFETQLSDVEVLTEFAETDPASKKELEELVIDLERDVDEAETEALLSGESDPNNAICSIQAGAGGTDAQDWAQMLMRMYLRWAERKDFKVEILDEQSGSEAGIKSATFRVEGDYAYGLLAGEAGVHRLVRISPFNSGGSRETSFASFFVSPEIDDDIEVDIQEKDLRVDTYRSTGAGGQHVNTTDSAVRITHIPTGIVVTCQNQRSQIQNRQVAMQVLRSRLYEVELEKRRAEAAELEESKQDISFGSQIRNYVLHPYRLVKDTRTKLEESDVDSVLDGDIDPFIKDFLLYRKSRG
ncbi:MAG: peptide chain release factor 2 [Acidobacteria bacterium]|nr:MAG: peptide chain release factor 2 [Acidobacteriota bacterium]REK02661.1 MAG: peptide chain release factor 2 [Acidobacteriota bacterium]REK13534.1 MAG: peptide chain release factor 2 [Acidobacteriota bacterium]REK41528.1 MAG: peptide chain release factor 2 [Acidobacteriota bacterium]